MRQVAIRGSDPPHDGQVNDGDRRAAADGAAGDFGSSKISSKAALAVKQMTRPQIAIRRNQRIVPLLCGQSAAVLVDNSSSDIALD
jgi:hypothetical protein